MRKVTAGLFISVDGVVEDPFLWQFDSFDEELGTGMGEMMGRIDAGILGRVATSNGHSIGRTPKPTRTSAASSTRCRNMWPPGP